MVDGIQTFQANTESHLSHADDDCELHLEGIKESNLLGAHIPLRVKTEGIYTVFQLAHLSAIRCLIIKIAWSE